MIWRFTEAKLWWEYKVENGYVLVRRDFNPDEWKPTFFRTIEEAIAFNIGIGAKMEILHAPIILEDNKIPKNMIKPILNKLSPTAAAGCCPSPFPAYKQGKYYCENCGETEEQKQLDLFHPDIFYPSTPAKTSGRCTCGSKAVGSDRHSDYCDLYRKP